MLVELPHSLTGSAFEGPVPPKLASLFEAAKNGEPLEPPVQAVLAAMGFSSFLFGMTTSPTRRNEGRFYYSTDAPREWIAEYDHESYIEIDPRVEHCWTHLTPLIWDRQIACGKPRLEHFLERASHHGVGSGVAIGFRGNSDSRIGFSVHSPSRDVSESVRRAWTGLLGDIALLAVHFHALFTDKIVDRNLEPCHRGAPLSPREKDCLSLAAKGQTSSDIGEKLSISKRTVNFHFCNIFSKLAVANRQEAIAVAITQNLLAS